MKIQTTSTMCSTCSRNYVLIIAHPDDESMFFLPTLTTLNNAVTHKHTGISSINSSSSSCSTVPVPVPVPPTPTNRLFILCLSNGNYDNLGSVRERELRAAADIISNCDNTGGSDNDSGSENDNDKNTTKYHLNNPINVTTINDERLQDGPEESWDPDIIANAIHDFISNENLEQESVVLMTFDEGGVSGHINHVHTYKGVLHYYHHHRREDLHRHRKNRIHQDNQRDAPAAASDSDSELHVDAIHMTLWTLKSVRNPIIKYVPLMILLQFMWGWILKCSSTSLFMTQNTSTRTWCSNNAETKENCTRTSTGTGISFYMINPSLVWNAMKAHRSQFVWYRRLFVVFSRYSYANDFAVFEDEDEGGQVEVCHGKLYSNTRTRTRTRTSIIAKGEKAD